jgi:MFS family permease
MQFNNPTFRMNPPERQALLILASVYSLRMLGLFMILPVFAIYATKLTGVTPFGIGIALGIYGLTQAIFQIPFGYISDRLGRKPLIILGLLLLALGSVVAALSHSMMGVIIGRGIQGMGATGGVIMALLADLTREDLRLRAMAFIGLSIGFSFALAFILGPILSAWVGVQGIFGMTALFSLAAVSIVIWLLPNVTVLRSATSSQATQTMYPLQPLSTVSGYWNHLRKAGLLPLYIGILILHASLTAIFLKIPQAVENFQFEQGEIWKFYLLILLVSCILTIPIILWMERTQKFKQIMAAIIMLLALSEFGMWVFFHSLLGLSLCMTLFFTAFNVLEASLPSLISKNVAGEAKGTALGIFSALQFLGLFLGGFFGGLLDSLGGLVAVISFCVILALIWFVWNIKGLNLWHEA